SWIDLVYMSGHTLDGVVAADVLAVALYLGLPGDGTRLSRQRLWLVGGVLGLTFVLRFQLGPALLVAAAGICGWRGSGKRWLALIAGASIPVLVLGLLDWATLGVPFKSIFINVWVNLALGVSAEAGKEPFYTYLVLPLDIWGPVGFVAVIGTAAVGARRLPLLAAVAIAMIAVLSFIPHKEYRFIYPAIVLVIILSGVGTSDLIALLRDAIPRLKAATPALVGAAILLWCGLSYSIARSAIFSIPWTRERAQIEAFRNVADHRGACGLGLLGVRWTVTPGMSWLPPQVPLVQLRPATFDADARAVDYVLARARFRRLTGYERTRCFAGDTDASGDAHMRLCLWHRAGGCTTKVAALPVNWPGVLVKAWHRAPPPWDEQAAVPR
ncbi:MAG: hypothetical protein ACREFD_13495, partial [Stellaceae bacterium]